MVYTRSTTFIFLFFAKILLVGGAIPDQTCTANDQCLLLFPNTRCTDGRCECEDLFTLSADGNYCEKVTIGTRCTPGDDGNSMCQAPIDGSAECDVATERCLCSGTGIYVVHEGDHRCVGHTDVPECQNCLDTGGACLDDIPDGDPEVCACPPNLGSSTINAGCDIHEVPTGGCCTDPSSICSDPHASCKVATDLSFDSFCECNLGYVAVPRPYDPVHADCRLVVHAPTHGVCATCEENGGTCYENGQNGQTFCLCPPTKSSSSLDIANDACDANHFELDCETENRMLCFIPGSNPHYQSIAEQIMDGDSLLYMRGHPDDLSCHFTYDAVNDKFCIEYSTFGACGIDENDWKRATTYSGWVVLQLNSLFLTTGDLCVYAYCRYDKLTHVTTSAVDVVQRKQIAAQGEVVRPETEIKIEDRFGVELGELNGGKLGSQVKLIIEMTDDKGVYTAMRAEVCVASNSLNLQVPGTQAVVFIMNGCPTENSFISGGINFYPTDDPLVIETELFGLPKFAVGDYVFFHCAVRVCINSDDCEVNCDTRRKRSAVLPGGALPSSVHQLVPVSKRTADKSLYQALESPDLEQKVIGIRVRDNDQSTEEDRHGPTEPERDDRTRYENDDRRPVDTRPSEYGRRPYQDRRGSVYDDYYRSIYDRRQPDESERSNNAVLVISIIVSSLVTLVVSAVLVFVCYVRPRRLQMAQAQQSEKV